MDAITIHMDGRQAAIVEQGATYDETWTFLEQDGTPVDFSGWTAALEIRTTYDAPVALLRLTTENGGLVLGGAAGTLRILMTDTQTASLPVSGPNTANVPRVQAYVYDVLATVGAFKERLAQGRAVVSARVTT